MSFMWLGPRLASAWEKLINTGGCQEISVDKSTNDLWVLATDSKDKSFKNVFLLGNGKKKKGCWLPWPLSLPQTINKVVANIQRRLSLTWLRGPHAGTTKGPFMLSLTTRLPFTHTRTDADLGPRTPFMPLSFALSSNTFLQFSFHMDLSQMW